MKFAIQFVRRYAPHLRHVATLPWEIEYSIFSDIEQIWKKMQTNWILSAPIFNPSTRVTVYAECIYVLL